MGKQEADEARKKSALAARRRRYAAARDEINARRRARYAADADFRKREQERKRRSAELHAARRAERIREDAEFRDRELRRKREWIRRYRARKAAPKKASPAATAAQALSRRWESVARGGPKKVAQYMKSAHEPERTRFLHWYGKRMNWIDSTGGRKFQPPPGADVYAPSDDFFFS